MSVCVLLLFIRRTYMYYYGWSHMLCYIHGDCWFLCSVCRLLDPVFLSFLCSVWRLLDPVGDYLFLCSVWRLLDPVFLFGDLLDPVFLFGDYSFLCSVWRLLDPVFLFGDRWFFCSVWRLLVQHLFLVGDFVVHY